MARIDALMEKLDRSSRDARPHRRPRRGTPPPADVQCNLCQRTVPRKKARKVTQLGWACKAHQGV